MKAEQLHRVITAMNTKINDIIGQETGGVHFGGHTELIAAVASIEELYDLSYVPEAEAKRTGIMHIMISAMLEGQRAEQIIQTLKSKGLTEDDAYKVAKSEKKRVESLADWYEYYGAGYKFFSAKHEDDACEICKEAYENDKKYPMEQLNMLPPLHGECRCDLMFHRK
jgi:hypothetical protein